MGFTTRRGAAPRAARASSPTAAWEHFDQGTQRAILKLYRSAPPEVLERARRAARRAALPGARPVARGRPLHRRGASARPTPTRSAERRSSSSSRAATGPGTTGPSSSGGRPIFSAVPVEPGHVSTSLTSAVLRAVVSAVTAPPRAPATEPAEAPVPRFRRGARPRRPGTARIDWWHAAPILVALLFAIVYLIWQPRTVDLAAHTFRAELFGEEGFTIWNGQWYGGHHTPGLLDHLAAARLAPEPAGRAGVRRGGVRRPVPAARARPLRRGARPLGLDLVRRRHRDAAVHEPAAVRDRRGASGSPRCSRCSATATGGRSCSRSSARSAARWRGCSSRWRASPTRSPSGATASTGSRASRSRPRRSSRRCSSRGPSPRAAGRPSRPRPTCRSRCSRSPCLIVLPREEAALRWGAALYGLGATAALAVETPMGGNAVRLGALFGGPVLLCALWGRRFRHRFVVLPLLAVGFGLLAFWQWSPAGARRRSSTSRTRPPSRTTSSRCASSSSRCPTSAGSRSRSRAVTGRAPRSRWSSRSRAAGCASSTRACIRSSTARASTGSPTRAGSRTTASATWRCRARSPTRAPTASAR